MKSNKSQAHLDNVPFTPVVVKDGSEKFTQIPNAIWDIKNISGNDIRIYGLIKSNAVNFHPTIKFLAEVTGMSDRTVKNSIKTLEAVGIISIYRTVTNGNKNRNYYQINPMDQWRGIEISNPRSKHAGEKTTSEPGEKTTSEPQVESTPIKEKKKKKKKTMVADAPSPDSSGNKSESETKKSLVDEFRKIAGPKKEPDPLPKHSRDYGSAPRAKKIRGIPTEIKKHFQREMNSILGWGDAEDWKQFYRVIWKEAELQDDFKKYLDAVVATLSVTKRRFNDLNIGNVIDDIDRVKAAIEDEYNLIMR